jgi:hypothetical protein
VLHSDVIDISGVPLPSARARSEPPGSGGNAWGLFFANRGKRPSADVSDASFGLRCILVPWQLKHHRLLTLFETGQKRKLSIRELQRVVMRRRTLFVDLPENRSSVIEPLLEPA